MAELIFFVLLAVCVSFLCSILEAAFLSITPIYIAAAEKRNVKHAAPLRALKEDPENSLAAILTLNTVANTIGATGAGAQALVVFGDKLIAVFTAIFTIIILVVSEIIPKSLGAIFWRQLATFVATMLPLFVKVLKPFVWVSD